MTLDKKPIPAEAVTDFCQDDDPETFGFKVFAVGLVLILAVVSVMESTCRLLRRKR